MDTIAAVIIGVTLVPIFGTVAGMIHDELEARHIRGRYVPRPKCTQCGHPEHPMICQSRVVSDQIYFRVTEAPCGCDLMTDPEE